MLSKILQPFQFPEQFSLLLMMTICLFLYSCKKTDSGKKKPYSFDDKGKLIRFPLRLKTPFGFLMLRLDGNILNIPIMKTVSLQKARLLSVEVASVATAILRQDMVRFMNCIW